MAVIADYINMSVSLVLSNKQGTDVEYRLPNDIRKGFDDFALPLGYSINRGTLANGATKTIGAVALGMLFALFLSDACSVQVYDTGGTEVTLNLAMLILSSNKDADLLLRDVTTVIITNGTGATVEWTYVQADASPP